MILRHCSVKLQISKSQIMLLLLLISASAAAFDLSSDRAALLAIRSAVGGRTLFWNISLADPCNWSGIRCVNNRVTFLRLPASSLAGVLPMNTVSNLTYLRTLSLRFNHLSGAVPEDLHRLSRLRSLFLQGNRFSGIIPSSLYLIHSLVRVNLGFNNLSGEISSGFNNLTRLRTLFLENNRFSGLLPNIELPNLDQFNVSFNRDLEGAVPIGLRKQFRSAFLGTSLCGKPLDNVCAGVGIETPPPFPPPFNGTRNSGKKKLSVGVIVGIVIGSVLGFILLLLILFILCKKRNVKNARSSEAPPTKNQETEANVEEENATGIIGGISDSKSDDGAQNLVFFANRLMAFDMEELLRASAEVLGKGMLGTSYKAVLEVGTVVTVKRLREVTVSAMEFREEIGRIGVMDHENLMPLTAYYYSTEEKLLIHEYMPMGSLSTLLHGKAGSTPLDWRSRTSIALGAARGIHYVHSQGANVSHGNIKSSNILLTNSHTPKFSDFCLNHLVRPSSTIRHAGYRAPEVTNLHRVSQKADVYSFGVVLLELMTRKMPGTSPSNEDDLDLPRWVQSIVREEWTSNVFDPELLHSENDDEDMLQLLQLGIECTSRLPEQRPSISIVVQRIDQLVASSRMG